MKKVLTLCLFVFALFLGTESAIGQTSKIEVNAKAAKKTETLRKVLKFNDTQRDLVYNAYQEYTQATLDLQNATQIEEGVKAKIEKLLETKMKGILSDEQFYLYKSYSDE